uniref:FAD-binding domain-containing protein n=1 Tax=Kalanchoe fedtschenkoi TaxID=63787 RepID=A0A7N0RGA9_KALFE
MSLPSKLLHHHFFNPTARFDSNSQFPKFVHASGARRLSRIVGAQRSRRVGKLRYPSEKKKLKEQRKPILEVENKFEGFWRLLKLGVPVESDPGKDFLEVSEGLLQEIAKAIEFPVASLLPAEAFKVVRKSFDARKLIKGAKFVYTVDMDVKKLLDLEPRTWDFISRLEPKVGLIEHMPQEKVSGDLISIIHDVKQIHDDTSVARSENNHIGESHVHPTAKKPKVGIVGSGPSGLFAALVLAELGADVTLLERGQPVEQRGRDIGSLIVRRILQQESNFCFGEGGAGTWSDGKLVTRIGRNSGSVLAILKTLVHFGAPKNILVDGKPHLGTDKLIPLLRNFREYLLKLGVAIKFGTRVDNLIVEGRNVAGVEVSSNSDSSQCEHQEFRCDALVLAVGHSARDVYKMLLTHGVYLVPKDVAIGLRVEHPQELINGIQYSKLANDVHRGRGKIPVADYKVVKYVGREIEGNSINPEATGRSCYSFCMCPGGQVVLTSINPSELCVNGMSFSKRASKWANAALVVSVSSKDFREFDCYGPLAGVEYQGEFERRAAAMGGGDFTVPVQTVTDFLESKLSATPLPPSSYRLGVKAAPLHEIYPNYITDALRNSLETFDKELPGFITNDALLHGVEASIISDLLFSFHLEHLALLCYLLQPAC